ncbi:MAG: tRNA (adenosine(37)-N6)-threonylcarbamoyltransferase complex ATPase subunit type 1 TsaE [Alphaproteobacteria bacterium]|nr:tRNA (adenosine(37)-N6)-threonylcarbamoyltransferase complex ATPase subunit type 1 TsaE [Alphaproteobacteria bacterium]
MEFICNTEEDTVKFGQKLATFAKKGDVFALYGTLGMGKTVLSRAFIQKLCDTSEVPSPTFTLLQIYNSPKFPIYHFDLYRLKSPEEIFEIGMEEAIYDGVSLIEWPEKMGGYIPKKSFKINILPYKKGRKIIIDSELLEQKQRLEQIDK